MTPLSTVIITYNEEAKIERCITSALKVSDEVIVLDSFSTDKTVDIAKSLGAKVVQHKFMGYIKQRELSVSHASYDLVLALDADEYLSDGLIKEINTVKENPSYDAYRLNRLSSISGHWIRYGSWHPDYIIRLFDKSKVVCDGETPHDRIRAIEGAKVKKIKPVLYHDAHDSIEDRIATIKSHSTVAAQTKFDKGVKSHSFKKYIKTIWKFLSEYFLMLGFLDGYYGWIAAKTTAQYIYLRESKIIELQKQNTK